MFNKKHIIVVIALGVDDVYLGSDIFVSPTKVSDDTLTACMHEVMEQYPTAVRTSASVTPV
jgi:hypothetical protein